MASVLFGGGVSLIVGKHGGSAFQRRRGGIIVRAKVMPINTRTIAAGPSRVYLSNLSHFWSNNLAPAQVTLWNSYAVINPVMNRVGQVSTLSGQQMFFKLNMNLLSAGFTMINVPPVTNAVGTPSSIVITPASGGSPTIMTTLTIGSPTANDVGIVRLTPSMSKGRSYVSSQLRSMLVTLTSGTPIDLYPYWQTFFGIGPASTGQQLLGRTKVLNSHTGIVSAELAFSARWV